STPHPSLPRMSSQTWTSRCVVRSPSHAACRIRSATAPLPVRRKRLANEIADMLKQAGGQRPTPVVVSESGASVYSASQLAADEFPDMDVSLRGAVSIARRLQDPL
ncbi:RNA-binding transcriptional accessory protein, partial [Bacteroides fragilis]|nr:RNA-binding transcriptional accessory protein [Bacteroides fragilis]